MYTYAITFTFCTTVSCYVAQYVYTYCVIYEMLTTYVYNSIS